MDYDSLERLVEWYIQSGAAGLFAACQSSEIMHLSDREMFDIVCFVVRCADDRVPVVASGHTADTPQSQLYQLQSMVEAGADGIVLITNRLGEKNAPETSVIEHMEYLLAGLPGHISMGLYECPLPWKRSLSHNLLKWCVDQGRFTFLKDTCCDIHNIAERLRIARDTPFKLYNANAPTLFDSLKMGSSGYSGVMANYYCDLYVWLCQHFNKSSVEVEEMALFLSATSLYELLHYPVSAKFFHLQLGNFNSIFSREANEKLFYTSANILLIEHLQKLAKIYRQKTVQRQYSE